MCISRDDITLFTLAFLYVSRFHTALRNTGLVALSTPYIDALGTGAIITAAHTIYRGELNHQHTTNDQVIGVLGADFPLSYFQK